MCARAFLCFYLLQIASSATCLTDDGFGSCAADSTLAADDTSLLQQRQRVAGKSMRASLDQAPDPPNFRRAVTFKGGGFMSLADFTGATMGFLNVLRKTNPDASMTQLYSRFGTVSGISGGSWFSQMLIYSPSFLQMVERGAELPQLAGLFYNAQVTVPLFTSWPTTIEHNVRCIEAIKRIINGLLHKTSEAGNASEQTEGTSLAFEATVETALSKFRESLHELPPALEDLKKRAMNDIDELEAHVMPDIQEFVQSMADQGPEGGATEVEPRLLLELVLLVAALFKSTGGISWIDMIGHLFLAGAGIDPSEPLGTKNFNEWASGKLNLVVATAVTPPGDDLFYGNFSIDGVTFYNISNDSMSYTAKSGRFNTLQPAMFSSIVGGGEEQVSPRPFVVSPDSDAYVTQWHHNGKPVGGGRKLQDRYHTAIEKEAGKLPIVGASSASSSFRGLLGLEHSFSETDCVVLSTWTTDVGEGQTFEEADAIRSKAFSQDTLNDALVEEVSNLSPMPLIDGGDTDDTGIATAVAAGATDIFAFLDEHLKAPDLLDLFDPSDSLAAIFKSPNHSEVLKLYQNNFSSIPAKAGSRFLKQLHFGTIECVTKNNVFFGIPEDIIVNITVFSVEQENITIGFPTAGFTSYFDYGELVTEIVEAMVDDPQTELLLKTSFGPLD